MSKNPFREYTTEEMGKLFGPVIDLITAGLADGTVCISKNQLDALKAEAAEAKELRKQATEVKELRKQVADQATIIRNLTTSRDTAVQQRDAARAANTVNSGEAAARIQENEDLKRQLRNLQGRLRTAEKQAASAKGMEAKPDPRYNKLQKDYTACKNQRDSFQKNIAALNITIRGLEDEIKELQKGNQVEVPYIIVDGINWDAKEVRQMRNVSVARAAQINELTNKLNAMTSGVEYIRCGELHYSESDIKSLLNTINQLRREIDTLKQNRPTICVKGKYMTVSQIEGVMDRNLKYAAEIDRLNAIHKRAASTLRGTTTSVKRERAKRHELEEQLKRLQNTGASVIEVGPQVVELHIIEPVATSIVVAGVKVEASLIPQMAGDLVSKTTEIQGLQKIIDEKSAVIANKDTIIEYKDTEIKRLKDRNYNQAESLRVCDQTIIDMRDQLNKQGAAINAKDAELNRLKIEQRLIKGRMNEQKQKHSDVNLGAQIIQSGQTYITTDIGLVAVTSEGVRRLGDAYHKLKCKVDALSSYLEHWATD